MSSNSAKGILGPLGEPAQGRLKHIRVDIAARDGGDHRVALDIVLAEKGRRKGHRAARFCHQLEPGKGERHGVQRLILAHHKAGAAEAVHDGKGNLARLRRDDGVAKPGRSLRVALDPARGKRAGGIVKPLRLAGAGASASNANAMPEVRPPPPQHTSTSAVSMPSAAASSAISRPVVPWPAITCGSS